MQSLLSDKKNHNELFLLIFSFFIATLFFLTGDFQEDALITFRTARKKILLQHQNFSFEK